MISSYANFLEQRTFLHFTVFNPNISIHNMVAVPLFWETNMAALTSCEDELWHQLKIQEYSLLALIMLTAAWLVQLGERRSAEREVAGSNPGRTNTQGL